MIVKNSSSLKIRAYQEQDQAAVIALWQECGLLVPWNDPAKDISRKLDVDRDLFLIGDIGSRIVATVMGGYEGHRGWINYLGVARAHQRKGYGVQMMGAVEALLKAKGCPKINLQVRSKNAEVIAFYQSIGYGNDNVVSLGKRLESDTVAGN